MAAKHFTCSLYVYCALQTLHFAGFLAVECCRGEPIPRIDYTPEEVAVWGTALSKLKALFPSHACAEFNAALPNFNFRCELHTMNCSSMTGSNSASSASVWAARMQVLLCWCPYSVAGMSCSSWMFPTTGVILHALHACFSLCLGCVHCDVYLTC